MSPPSRRRTSPRSQRTHRLLDRLGAYGSLLCAIHCALLPVAIALLPAFGLVSLGNEGFEQGFVAFATLLGLFSLIQGYRRHGVFRALWLLLPGLLVLWLAVLYRPLHESQLPHALAMTLGGCLVGLAHVINLRLNHGHVHDASCSH